MTGLYFNEWLNIMPVRRLESIFTLPFCPLTVPISVKTEVLKEPVQETRVRRNTYLIRNCNWIDLCGFLFISVFHIHNVKHLYFFFKRYEFEMKNCFIQWNCVQTGRECVSLKGGLYWTKQWSWVRVSAAERWRRKDLLQIVSYCGGNRKTEVNIKSRGCACVRACVCN
jgi:hypothetical protein